MVARSNRGLLGANMSNVPVAYMLNQYALCSEVLSLITVLPFPRHFWPPTFTQSECIRMVGSAPRALPTLSNGGILPLVFHIEFAITGRRTTRRLHAYRNV